MVITRWEYLTATLEANVEVAPVPRRDDIPSSGHTRYTHYTLIPQLNGYGEQGWELISIQPIVVGKNGDVVVPDGTSKYARHYFCSFKRQIG